MGHAGLSRPVLAKLKIIKNFVWSAAAISNKTSCHKKWTIEIIIVIVIVFSHFDLTIQQDKKCLVFVSENNIKKFYMVRLYVISAIICLAYLLKSHPFYSMNA